MLSYKFQIIAIIASNLILGYMIAGKVGVFASGIPKTSYLILRYKNQEYFIEPIKYRLFGVNTIERVYNYLLFFSEKGYI